MRWQRACQLQIVKCNDDTVSVGTCRGPRRCLTCGSEGLIMVKRVSPVRFSFVLLCRLCYLPESAYLTFWGFNKYARLGRYRCPEWGIRKLAHELKNTSFLPFIEAITLARSRWTTKEPDQERDFAVRPQQPMRPPQTPKTTSPGPQPIPTDGTEATSTPAAKRPLGRNPQIRMRTAKSRLRPCQPSKPLSSPRRKEQ